MLSAYGIPTWSSRTSRAAPNEAVKHRREDRLSGRPQGSFAHDHAQNRRRRREALICAAQPRSRRRSMRDQSSPSRERRVRRISSELRSSRWSSCDGYELILGSSIDPQFGPVLLFGAGGQLVEVFKDRALGLPPLNAHPRAPHDGADADLRGASWRARTHSRSTSPRSKQLLVRFSQLVAEQPRIKEIDINPLLASSGRWSRSMRASILHRPRYS